MANQANDSVNRSEFIRVERQREDSDRPDSLFDMDDTKRPMSTLIDVVHGRLTPHGRQMVPILSNRANFQSRAGYRSPTPIEISTARQSPINDRAVTPLNLPIAPPESPMRESLLRD